MLYIRKWNTAHRRYINEYSKEPIMLHASTFVGAWFDVCLASRGRAYLLFSNTHRKKPPRRRLFLYAIQRFCFIFVFECSLIITERRHFRIRWLQKNIIDRCVIWCQSLLCFQHPRLPMIYFPNRSVEKNVEFYVPTWFSYNYYTKSAVIIIHFTWQQWTRTIRIWTIGESTIRGFC